MQKCKSQRWIGEKGLSLSDCWEKLQCNIRCDLSHGLFQYADATSSADQNCGCAQSSDCKNSMPGVEHHSQVNTYEYKGTKTGSLIALCMNFNLKPLF